MLCLERLESRCLLATWSGDIPDGTIWSNTEIQRIVGTARVPAGSTLTVEPGTLIKTNIFAGLSIFVEGTLNANGTVAQPIVFTSLRDDTGLDGIQSTADDQDTNADGPSVGGNGDWNRIEFKSSSTGSVLNQVRVRFGGASSFAAVVIDGANLSMTNSVVQKSSSSGVRIQTSNPTLTNNIYRDNLISPLSMDLASNPNISGVTTINNASNALLLDTGELVVNCFWDDRDIVYRTTGDVTVPAGKTLTIGAGQVVKFREFADDDLIVNGSLIADGTTSLPIVFTSNRDDTIGGDTNNDVDGSNPGNGNWGAIQLQSGSSANILDFVDVRYGGGNRFAELISSAPMNLTNSILRNSSSAGVRVQDNTVTIADTVLEMNSGVAISASTTGNIEGIGIRATSNSVDAIVIDGGTLASNQSWSGRGIPYRLGGELAISSGITLRIDSGVVFEITESLRMLGTGRLDNAGTIRKSTGTSTATIAPKVVNTGNIKVLGGTLNLANGLSDNGNGNLIGLTNATLSIGQNYSGDTKNLAREAPLMKLLFNGAGTAGSPQLFEALGSNQGNVGAGFDHNLAFYSLALTNNTYVKLVDNSNNAPGSSAEAGYVSNLEVPAGTTLDLNGLSLYARTAILGGTITGGIVSILPDGGPLALDSITPGKISSIAEIDDWTFFGRAGQSATVEVNTGSAGATPPLTPSLNFAQVRLVDSSDRVLGTANNTSSGADVSLAGITLPKDGTYHIQVQAPSAQANSTGNYVLTAWNATVQTTPVGLNQNSTGNIDTPFRVDRWTFSSTAGEVLNFKLLNAENSNIQFDLTGPNGFTAFSNQTSSANNITLPTTGSYAVTVYTTQRQTGAYAFRLDTVSVTSLTLGTLFTGVLAGGTQSQFFKVNLAQSQQLNIKLTDSSSTDRNEVYASFGAAPTRSNFRYRSSTPASADQQVNVPSAAPGDWYVLVYTESAVQPGNISLLAQGASVFLASVTPDHSGNGADIPITLTGLGFDSATTVQLVSASNATFPASRVRFDLPTQLTATFSAGTLSAGVYSVRVSHSDGTTATLSNVFTVLSGGTQLLTTNLILPRSVGYHEIAEIDIEYSNTGTLAMPAPLLVLTGTQTHADGVKDSRAFLTLDRSKLVQGFWTSALPEGFTHTIQILGSGSTPGILQPGESVRVPVYYAGWQQPWDFAYPPIRFSLNVLRADDATPLDWNALKNSLPTRPIDAGGWNVIFDNLIAQTGNSWGAYVRMLDANASYLASLGENPKDVGELLAFAIKQADGLAPFSLLAGSADLDVEVRGIPLTFTRTFGATVSSRFALGPLGRGWSFAKGWQRHLTVESDGSVLITDPKGAQLKFEPDRRGGYFNQAGNHSLLTATGASAYSLREINGLFTAFRSDGNVDFVEDTNGNRVTAGYTGVLLTSLTHSSGSNLQIVYNAAGRIIRVTASDGRVTSYSYDAGNEHLLAATGADGATTSYTYDTNSGVPTQHSLLSVAYSDGTHDLLSYDAQGRLKQVQQDGGNKSTALSYGPAGTVVSTDSTGDSVKLFFDEKGLLARVSNSRKQDLYMTYNSDLQVTQITDAAGQIWTKRYDTQGNLVSLTDPLGHAATFTYSGLLNRILKTTDANGNAVRYATDSKGNVTSRTYADNTSEALTYNATGSPTAFKNRQGSTFRFQYDSAGRITSKISPDESHVDFVYDARGNLTSATDARGTTSLTFDTFSRLTRITYPDNRFLQMTYDSQGRRTQLIDQGGFTINYAYDGAGRLATLKDGGGTNLVTYEYNAEGLISKEAKGNGTFTSHDYDSGANLLHLINHAADGAIVSRFDFAYDGLGRRIGMTTLDGHWDYRYDAVGQLTHAVFQSTNLSIPNQDLTYVYDPAGNRIRTVVNGVTTQYQSNFINEYTAVGSGLNTYDANGNLTVQRIGNDVSSFVYDDENRLLQAATPEGTWSYEYDVFGQRVKTTHNGQSTNYLIDPIGLGNVVAEYNGSGQLLAHYVQGQGLVGRVDASNAAAFYNYDGTGNTSELSNAAGNVANRYAYLPFGERLSQNEAVVNAFQFGGQFGVMRDGNGLILMRSRFYEPKLGRFVQTDPAKSLGGLNAYQYAGNNPIANVDPSGMREELIQRLISALTAQGAFRAVHMVQRLAPFLNEGALIEIGKDLGINLLAAPAAGGAVLAAESVPLAAGAVAGTAVATGTVVELTAVQQLAVSLGGRIVGNSIVFSSADAAIAFHGAASSLAAAPAATSTAVATSTAAVGGAATPAASAAASTGALATTAYLLGAGLAGYAAGTLINNYFLSSNTRDSIGDFLLFVFDRSDWNAANGNSGIVGSRDPNEKIGPAGFGSAGFVLPNTILPYRINFENDKDASAPAQRVTITDQLNTNVDLKTFELSEIGFGDLIIAIPPGNQHYQTTVQMTQNGKSFEVQIEAGLRSLTGEMFAIFQSIDPETSLPPDVLTGFLPPEDGTGRGMGHISYAIQPKSNLPTGTQIRNVALITFDFNPSIATDQQDPHDPTKGIDLSKQALNTLDAGAPSSRVTALPAQSPSTFVVHWTGADDAGGSGIATYDIFVSVNATEPVLWLHNATTLQASYTGDAGKSYGFFSVAADAVGNRETAALLNDAFTTVSSHRWQNQTNRYDVDNDGAVAPLDVLLIINNLKRFGTRTLPESPAANQLPPPYVDVDGDDAVAPIDVLQVINFLKRRSPSGEGEIEDQNSMPQSAIEHTTDSVMSIDSWMEETLLGKRTMKKRTVC